MPSERYPPSRHTKDDASGGRTATYSYDQLGRIAAVDYPGGIYTGGPEEEYLYDSLGRLALTRAVNEMSGQTPVYRLTAYVYDDLDRLLSVDYNYQGDFEVTSAWPPQSYAADVSCSYDDAARTVSVEEKIDGINTVTSVYKFDKWGRLTSYTPALPVGYGAITYTWNNLDQKTSMTIPMGGNKARRIEYAYDNMGRYAGKIESIVDAISNPVYDQGTTDTKTRFYYDHGYDRVKLITKSGDAYYFVYDPTASVPSVVYEEGPGYRYVNVREPSGALYSRERYDKSGDIVYVRKYLFDGLGNTVALTDESGTVTDTYSYDAWGNCTPGAGNTTFDNPYRYVGELGYYTHYMETGFNLLQVGFRYYDPQTGRFTQQDPIQDGLNWYAYCGGNPINWVDPWGLSRREAYEFLWKRRAEITQIANEQGIDPMLLAMVVHNEVWAGPGDYVPQYLNEGASYFQLLLGSQASIGVCQHTLSYRGLGVEGLGFFRRRKVLLAYAYKTWSSIHFQMFDEAYHLKMCQETEFPGRYGPGFLDRDEQFQVLHKHQNDKPLYRRRFYEHYDEVSRIIYFRLEYTIGPPRRPECTIGPWREE